MLLRNANDGNWPAILTLNEESVHFLSPMDEAQLAQFATAASYLRVIENSGKVAAFLMAFRRGDNYGGANFAWFGERYGDFLYIDRIVVAPEFRGKKLADRFYDDLESFARGCGVSLIACEVNAEPPNPVSLQFHARRGFREVGRVSYAGKIVSMLARDLDNSMS